MSKRKIILYLKHLQYIECRNTKCTSRVLLYVRWPSQTIIYNIFNPWLKPLYVNEISKTAWQNYKNISYSLKIFLTRGFPYTNLKIICNTRADNVHNWNMIERRYLRQYVSSPYGKPSRNFGAPTGFLIKTNFITFWCVIESRVFHYKKI